MMNFFITPMVRNLLFINIGMFIVAIFVSKTYSYDINEALGLHSAFSEHFGPWQFITYMFMHQYIDEKEIVWAHLLGNMFGLFMFGSWLEKIWGAKRFLVYYIVTGVGAGLLHWGINNYEVYQVREQCEAFMNTPSPEMLTKIVRDFSEPMFYKYQNYIVEYVDHPDSPQAQQYAEELISAVYFGASNYMGTVVGASGAIFGILLAFGMIFPNTELMLLFIPFPIKAKYFVTLYGLYEFVALARQSQGDNVAHFAHLAGMLFGFILIKYWGTKRDRFY